MLTAFAACSPGAIEAEDAAVPAVSQNKAPEERPMRVLVTGFNDWRDLGSPPNTWRCRDNPSCRLILGAEHDRNPSSYEGPLVVRLRRRAPDIEWSFATMPVTWEAF